MLHKNETIELTCHALGAQLEGVCRYEGQAVFVPGALPGERLLARVVKVEKRYAFAKVLQVLEPSAQRAVPPCPQYPRCGGCNALHMRYEATLQAKRQNVLDCLTRIGGADGVCVEETAGMQNPFRYRNKGAFPVAGSSAAPLIGCFAARSHAVVDAPEGCLLQTETSAALMDAVRGWVVKNGVPPYDEQRHAGLLRHVMTREAASGASMLILAVNGERIPAQEDLIRRARAAAPGLASVVLSPNTARTNVILGPHCTLLWGAPYLEETLCGFSMRISPQSFFQVNREQAERLCRIAVDFAALRPGERAWDLYCGCGTLTLPLAQAAGHVTGIEIVPAAVEDARDNARRNGVENVDFVCGAVEERVQALLAAGKPDVVVLDPPRKGALSQALHAVAAASPARIVYVSCNPATLARDVSILSQRGYSAVRAQPVDMFPWTAHVETVALLLKGKAGSKKVCAALPLEGGEMSGV